MKSFLVFLITLLSFIYLLNFSMGILEIPDYLPIVGNVDEAMAAAFFFSGLRYFGIDLTDVFKTKGQKQPLRAH